MNNHIKAKMENFSESTRKVLSDFFEENYTLSIASRSNYVFAVFSLLQVVSKDLYDISRDDVKEWIGALRKQGKSNGTINLYGSVLKRLMRWLENPCMEWWKPVQLRKREQEKLVSEEHIKRVLEIIGDPKTRALFCVIYEGALRSGEARNLKVKDISFEENYAILRVHGKTGERTIPIVQSAPQLQLWLMHHPYRDDPESYIFIVQNWNPRPYTRAGLDNMFSRLCSRADVPPFYPHMLRHTRLTELASMITEQELKVFAGWEKDSRMAAVYVHLSGRDAKDAILRAYGIKKSKKMETGAIIRRITCPRCRKQNPADAKVCYYCTQILDPEIALAKLKEIKEKEQEFQKMKRKLEKMSSKIDELMEIMPLLEEFASLNIKKNLEERG